MLLTIFYIYSQRIRHIPSYWIQTSSKIAEDNTGNRKDC